MYAHYKIKRSRNNIQGNIEDLKYIQLDETYPASITEYISDLNDLNDLDNFLHKESDCIYIENIQKTIIFKYSEWRLIDIVNYNDNKFIW